MYVAAQAVATEFSATTDIPDANVTGGANTNAAHGSGLGVSVSSYEVRYRIRDGQFITDMGKSPQWQASRKMDSYLNKDYNATATADANRITISNINLLTTTPNTTTPNPPVNEAAWIVSINGVIDTNAGQAAVTRTGKVTKVVYYRNGYKVTIENNNATVARY